MVDPLEKGNQVNNNNRSNRYNASSGQSGKSWKDYCFWKFNKTKCNIGIGTIDAHIVVDGIMASITVAKGSGKVLGEMWITNLLKNSQMSFMEIKQWLNYESAAVSICYLPRY